MMLPIMIQNDLILNSSIKYYAVYAIIYSRPRLMRCKQYKVNINLNIICFIAHTMKQMKACIMQNIRGGTYEN